MGNWIKKGDMVEVISGNDRGVRGKVLRLNPGDDKVVVSGVRIVKKHQRPVRAGRSQVQPGIIEFEGPIHVAKVMLVCPRCSARTRVGFDVREDGTKVRMCKKCGQTID